MKRTANTVLILNMIIPDLFDLNVSVLSRVDRFSGVMKEAFERCNDKKYIEVLSQSIYYW